MMTKFIIKANHRLRSQTIDWRTRRLHTREEIVPAIEEILQILEAAAYSGKERFAVQLSLEEALVNAIKHGHKDDPRKEVQLRYHLAPKHLLVEIEDQGPGFKLEDVPDPFAEENRELPCGRGLLLMRNYMSWVQFNDTGNRVTMCRRRANA
ncbi:MAG TPA: ATP-binding protein [Gemmataceae bacterium]|nr:ATP-binding protein [Gemmataceae bacterium]